MKLFQREVYLARPENKFLDPKIRLIFSVAQSELRTKTVLHHE